MQHLSRAAATAATLLCSVSLLAQTPSIETPPYARVSRPADSGAHDNTADTAQVVWATSLRVASATWVQVLFGENCHLPDGSFLRLTATADRGVQRHSGASLVEWAGQSALFNGDEVLLELVAGPQTTDNRVEVEAMQFGFPNGAPESICGTVDDRVQSNDPRQGRLFIGCTGWLIGLNNSGTNDLMITAGHCVDSGATRIIEFNVPLSTSGGNVVRSNPNDQYPFVRGQFLNAGVGQDWAINTVGRNSNTNLLPTEANGNQFYNLGSVPSPGGQSIRITGYGSVTLLSPTLNLVQKTHVGPMQNGANATALRYATDTTGGNSGSPVIHENTGDVIGVHTHAGCNSTGGGNQGTRIDRPDFASAVANAQRTPGVTTLFGDGCGTSQTTCASLNQNGGTLSNEFRNNEYAYRFTLTTPATITGFELFTASNNGTVNATARLYADAGGSPGATLAQGTISVAPSAAFYPVTLPPTQVPAGTYYIAVDHSSQNIEVSTLTSGGGGAGFWRRPALSGGWNSSNLVQRPSFRVQCEISTTAFSTAEPRIDAPLVTQLASDQPSAPASLFTGIDNTNSMGLSLPFALDPFGANGCALLVDPLLVNATTTNSLGSAVLQLPLPNDPNLVGFHLYQQWVVLAPTANTLGVLTSNGVDYQIGD